MPAILENMTISFSGILKICFQLLHFSKFSDNDIGPEKKNALKNGDL